MDTITIDGVDEHEFRRSVEDMLRLDEVAQAVDLLRGLLAPYVGHGRILPQRFLEVSAADVEIAGWDKLALRLASHDRARFPISAIGVALADARVLGGPGPQGGRLAPFLKTFYFSDDAYPFTETTRDELLDGYTREGFGWQGDYQATDATLAIKGIDDLHGAIIALEDRLMDAANPDDDHIRAGSIGACYVAVLIHQALRDTIRQRGLPRPLCVLAACDGVYPFFDAPVAGWDDNLPVPAPDAVADAVADAVPEDVWPNELEDARPAAADAPAGEASLLDLPARPLTKHLALTIGEDDAREAARFTQNAAAQRLIVEDESTLKGLLQGIPAAVLLDPADEDAEPLDRPAAEPALSDAPPLDLALPTEVEEPAPESAAPYPSEYDRPDPRELFRRAEEAQAFPSGTSLRQRFQPPPPPASPTAADRLQALNKRLRFIAARRLKRLARKLRALRKSVLPAPGLGARLARTGRRFSAAARGGWFAASWRRGAARRPARQKPPRGNS